MENSMNSGSRILSALWLLIWSLAASIACAQATPTFTSAPLTYVEADILRLLTRPQDATGVYPFYVVINVPVAMTCLAGTGAGNNKFWPVLYSNRTDSKLIRETLQLAYAMNKRVRIYTAQCANLDTSTTDYIYPVIWAVETL